MQKGIVKWVTREPLLPGRVGRSRQLLSGPAKEHMESLWHKNAIVYTIDVQSFADGNGDGIGDFLGGRSTIAQVLARAAATLNRAGKTSTILRRRRE
jgi:hypothetical protein